MAMDPVNKKALKKDFKDRADKDIDNDGDTDKTDEYLHKRRQAVSKAISKMKESVAVFESHFKVGDEVECIDSGMEGKVIKVDPEEKGKYYTVKREDGKIVKYAPDELRAEDDDDDDDNDDDKEDMNEDVRKMSHGRLKFHMNNKSVPHGSYSWDQMKAERDRRLKTGQGEAYKKAKMSMSEEAELNELSPNLLHRYVKKASADLVGRSVRAAAGDKKSQKKVGQRLVGISGASGRMSDKANQNESYINEKLKVSDGMGAWIDDFKKSDAPQFKGKDDKERREMAVAAFLAAKRSGKE